jgi:Ca-activated chloride channel family protein
LLFINVIVVLSLVFAVSGLTVHVMAKASSFSFVLAIDSSKSMEADDFSPSRIAVAKETAKEFVSKSPLGTRIGIISFSGGTKIERDMTDRKDELGSAIDGISVGGLGGTDIYEAVLTSTNLLKNDDNRAIIILSDGQINVGNIEDAIDYANYYNAVVNTIGMGTVEGGNTEYGLSKLDEDSLKSLAYNADGKYFSAESKENLSLAFSDMFNIIEKKVAVNLSDYLLIFALILLVLEFFLSNTRYINLI